MFNALLNFVCSQSYLLFYISLQLASFSISIVVLSSFEFIFLLLSSQTISLLFGLPSHLAAFLAHQGLFEAPSCANLHSSFSLVTDIESHAT